MNLEANVEAISANIAAIIMNNSDLSFKDAGKIYRTSSNIFRESPESYLNELKNKTNYLLDTPLCHHGKDLEEFPENCVFSFLSTLDVNIPLKILKFDDEVKSDLDLSNKDKSSIYYDSNEPESLCEKLYRKGYFNENLDEVLSDKKVVSDLNNKILTHKVLALSMFYGLKKQDKQKLLHTIHDDEFRGFLAPANHLLDFFGYESKILDRALDKEDRELFYDLEFLCEFLTPEREDKVIKELGTKYREYKYSRREWRTHSWNLKVDKIFNSAKACFREYTGLFSKGSENSSSINVENMKQKIGEKIKEDKIKELYSEGVTEEMWLNSRKK